MTETLELCVAQRWAFRILELQQSPLFTLGSVSKTWVLSGGKKEKKKKSLPNILCCEHNAIDS